MANFLFRIWLTIQQNKKKNLRTPTENCYRMESISNIETKKAITNLSKSIYIRNDKIEFRLMKPIFKNKH